MDYRYYITLERDGGTETIAANGLRGDMPEATRGATVSLTFGFGHDLPLDEPTGATWGGESGFTWGGEAGSTWAGGGVNGSVNRYEAVRQLLDWANTAATGQDANGVPYYRTRVPGDASVDSLAVKLEPGEGIQSGIGLWGIVTGGDDPTTLAAANARLSLDVFVLAEADEFRDHAELEAARRVN